MPRLVVCWGLPPALHSATRYRKRMKESSALRFGRSLLWWVPIWDSRWLMMFSEVRRHDTWNLQARTPRFALYRSGKPAAAPSSCTPVPFHSGQWWSVEK